MSNTEVSNDDDDLSQDDMIAYLRAKNVSAACELCSASKWNYGSQVYGARPIISFAKPASPRVQQGFVELIIGNCTNCGNIRTFNRWFYEDWKKRVIAEGDKSDE